MKSTEDLAKTVETPDMSPVEVLDKIETALLDIGEEVINLRQSTDRLAEQNRLRAEIENVGRSAGRFAMKLRNRIARVLNEVAKNANEEAKAAEEAKPKAKKK